MSNLEGMKQDFLTVHEQNKTVTHGVCVLCCVVVFWVYFIYLFIFFCLRPVSCIPNVASVYGLALFSFLCGDVFLCFVNFVFVLCFVYPMWPVCLDYPFLIACPYGFPSRLFQECYNTSTTAFVIFGNSYC